LSSLTSAGALPPILGNLVPTPETGSIVVQVLAARAVGDVASPLVQTLLAAAGPGKIISGTVDDAQADGTITVLTGNGTFVTLHHPPELQLAVGNTVVLRVVSTSPVPQAAVLAVNGRPVAARPGVPVPTPGPAAPQSGVSAGATAFLPRAAPVAIPTSAASIASALMATISFEDETAIEAAISGDGLTLGTTGAADEGEAIGPTLIATLVRPAPAKLGQMPLLIGTRYLVTVRDIGTTESSGPSADPEPGDPEPETMPPEPAQPAASAPGTAQPGSTNMTPGAMSSAATAGTSTPATAATTSSSIPTAGTQNAATPTIPAAALATGAPIPAPAASQSSLPTPPSNAPGATVMPNSAPSSSAAQPAQADLDGFQAQISVLAGRVAPPRTDGQTLIDTAIGTLALPVPDLLPVGTAIQLKITAVAPPLPHEAVPASAGPIRESATPPGTQTLIEETAGALQSASASLGMAIQSALALEPGTNLAAALFGFLAGIRDGNAPRSIDPGLRKALVDAGRSDLAARLDSAAETIGTIRPQQGPEGWTVTVMPFLGSLSLEPMRLYRKSVQDRDADGKLRGGQRFVLELALKRLGPLQFDGLVRERRFDLVVRSVTPMEPPLQDQLRQIFRDGMLISGWAGELGFGRAGRYPLMQLVDQRQPLDLGA
jgi:hypothetical protein